MCHEITTIRSRLFPFIQLSLASHGVMQSNKILPKIFSCVPGCLLLSARKAGHEDETGQLDVVEY